jgi:hypothetical protein
LFRTTAAKVCVLPTSAEVGNVTLVMAKSGKVWAGGFTVKRTI